MAALASTDDLALYGVDISNEPRAEAALEAVSAAIRDAAGVMISRDTGTFTVEGSRFPWLSLPVVPVISVASVEIDGEPVTDFRLIGKALWRRNGWAGCDPSLVTVTCTHGFDPVPADIVLLTCELAGAILAAASEGGVEAKNGVQSERIDDYYVAYETGEGGAITTLDLPERVRQSLSRRFGGGAHVVRSR